MNLHVANEGMWCQRLNRKMKIERRRTVTRCRWDASHVYITYDTVRGRSLAVVCFIGGGGGLEGLAYPAPLACSNPKQKQKKSSNIPLLTL